MCAKFHDHTQYQQQLIGRNINCNCKLSRAIGCCSQTKKNDLQMWCDSSCVIHVFSALYAHRNYYSKGISYIHSYRLRLVAIGTSVLRCYYSGWTTCVCKVP